VEVAGEVEESLAWLHYSIPRSSGLESSVWFERGRVKKFPALLTFKPYTLPPPPYSSIMAQPNQPVPQGLEQFDEQSRVNSFLSLHSLIPTHSSPSCLLSC